MHTLLTLTYFSYFLTIPLQWGLHSVYDGEFSLPISFNTSYGILAHHFGANTNVITLAHFTGQSKAIILSNVAANSSDTINCYILAWGK